MTIDIVQNGAIATGDVHAQPQKTGVLWDAYLIKSCHEVSSKNTLMFLPTVIERAIKEHFSYDNKCVWDKASQLSVYLPVDDSGHHQNSTRRRALPWDRDPRYLGRIGCLR